MDIFFVISGFLISGIIFNSLKNNTFSFVEFYVRRIRRIFPALIVVLVSCGVIGWFILLGNEYQQLGKHIAGGAGFVSNFILWNEKGYFDNAAITKPLLHLWSLGIEEQFYIIWPLLLWAAWKKRFNLLTIIILIWLISFGENLAKYKTNHDADFFSPTTRFWELLAGSMLAYLSINQFNWINKLKEKCNYYFEKVIYSEAPTEEEVTLSAFLSWFGILLITLAIFVTKSDKFPGKWALLPVIGTVCLIAAGSNAYINRKILSNRLMVWIGLISFPLYLWHWPLFVFTRIIDGEKLGKWQWIALRIGCIALSFLLAYLTYRLIERPIRFGKKLEKQKVIGLILLMLMTGLAGYTIYKKQGIPERFKHYLKVQENLKYLPRKNDAGEKYIGSELLNVLKNINKKEKRNVDFYHFNDVGTSQTIAIVGDSHARQAFSGIAEVNNKFRLNTFLVGADGRRSLTIDVLRTEILNILNKKSDIKHVFLFYRGIGYLTGCDLDSKKPCQPRKNDWYEKQLQNVINSLVKSGKKVYLVTENPVFNRQPRDYVRRPISLLKKPLSYPVMKKEEVIAHQKPYLNMLKQLKNVEIIYSLDKLCPNNECKMFTKEGIPLYLDNDHLSYEGAHYQAEQLLAPYLKEIVSTNL